jgi:hypothetical protein
MNNTIALNGNDTGLKFYTSDHIDWIIDSKGNMFGVFPDKSSDNEVAVYATEGGSEPDQCWHETDRDDFSKCHPTLKL